MKPLAFFEQNVYWSLWIVNKSASDDNNILCISYKQTKNKMLISYSINIINQ